MHGSFMRLAANQGAGSSLSRSYNLMATSRSNGDACDTVMNLSISASRMGDGRCDIAGPLNTVMWAGKQLLKLPDSPVHARMLTSPDQGNEPNPLCRSGWSWRQHIPEVSRHEYSKCSSQERRAAMKSEHHGEKRSSA